MVFRTQLTWCPLERVCHQPPHLVASSETSYVKASSLPSSLISAHTCFLPSFENDQFCLDDSGTMGYFGKKALLWLARVCVSAALQGRKRMWPSLIMAPELSCFLQLQYALIVAIHAVFTELESFSSLPVQIQCCLGWEQKLS